MGGDLVGTAFVARDMMQFVDALDEDGLLRYFGESSLRTQSNGGEQTYSRRRQASRTGRKSVV